MATFLPHHEVPSKPHQDLPSIAPPDPAIMHVSNLPPPNTNGPRTQPRVPTDYRGNGFMNGNGALPVPNGPHANVANGAPRRRGTVGGGPTGFDGPRSPPNTKNTSHVPCKFFRSGQCQAGKACPFSHSTDISTVDTPCKYFAKGNCKFGAKCALAHILPDGRRVNRPNGTVGGHLNLGGRVDPQSFHPQDSALANSLLAQQTGGNHSTFGHQFPPFPENGYGPQNGLQAKLYDNAPPIDTGYTSPRGSTYGSPPENGRLPISPIAHLSALDAPLPASFDSQGISFAARHGPVAASVPSKFGLDSPPSSLPKKVALPSDALRTLHDSAFGRESRGRAPSTLGSSPLGSGDEGLGQRVMHSQRVAKPKMMSASLPRQRANDEWDDSFLFGGEEDFLPTSLHDLLTPQEKLRTLSRSDHDPLPLRESLSGLGTPADPSSKVGSPSHASPSRYGALFARQRREEDSINADRISAFGHVGSPLRNSSLHPGASPSLRASSFGHAVPGDMSPYFASPPRQSPMSGISQQLSRTRLSSRTDSSNAENNNSSNNALRPVSASARHGSNGRLDRAISSSSIGTSRIDEEQGDCVFSMEEEEDSHSKRWSSGPWNGQGGGRSPGLGPIGGGRGSSGGVEGKEGREFWG